MVANTENTNDINNNSEILDLEGACALLGVGRNSLYYLIERKKIPCRRVGKSYRFLRSKLMTWLEGDPIATTSK
jgi:excisionase family DNA binding protein